MTETQLEAVNLPIAKPFGDYREYVDLNGFQTNILLDEVLKRHVLKTFCDTGRSWMYDAELGHYTPNAEASIRTYTTLSLGPEATKGRVEEVLYLAKQLTNTQREDMEPPLHLVNLENGVLDLEGHDLQKHSPENFFTARLPVRYNPSAECPQFLKFISEVVTPEDAKVLQEYVGYTLLRCYKYQKAVLLVGEGSNGKSTFLMVIKTILGSPNLSAISLQSLSRRFTPARLYHKLANIYPDLSTRSLRDTGLFKIATGGDMIEAEIKYSMNPIKFVNHAKLLYSCNVIPLVEEDDSDAFFRRWIIINFPNIFTEDTADKNILAKITTPEEMSGILNWALEGLRRLQANQGFSYDKTTDQIRDQYKRMSSSIYAFLEDAVEYDPQGWLPKDDLYSAYITYCIDNNLPRKPKNTFSKELPQHMPAVIPQRRRIDGHGPHTHGWEGIRLLTPEETTTGGQTRLE